MAVLDSTDSRENQVKSSQWFYNRPLIAFLLIGICIVIGLFYLVAQWSFTKVIRDSLFIGLLFGATLMLVQSMRSLYKFAANNSMSFFSFTLEGKEYDEVVQASTDFIRSIFNSKWMSFVGIIYGIAVGSAVFLTGVWTDQIFLRSLLFVFLFVVNFVTGIGFYGLIMFFMTAWKIGKLVKIDLWQRDNPSTVFLRRITHSTAIIASIYVCICISSILFSVFPIDSLTIGYSVFAGVIILACFIIPEIPVRKKIVDEKRLTLMDLNNQLQLEFKKSLEEAKNMNKAIDLSKIDCLMDLRQKVGKIHVWPFGMRTLTTAVSVILVTSLPAFLQILLERLF